MLTPQCPYGWWRKTPAVAETKRGEVQEILLQHYTVYLGGFRDGMVGDL